MDSCSFDIGENTLREIELQARNQITPLSTRNQSAKSYQNKRESENNTPNNDESSIIQESPNAYVPCTSVFAESFSRSKRFEKSKSTSILASRHNKQQVESPMVGISKYLQVEEIDHSKWEKSAAKLISPMVQQRPQQVEEQLTDYDNLQLNFSSDFEDTLASQVIVDKSVYSQDIFTDDPLDTAITGDIDIDLSQTEDLESSVRNLDNVTFIQPRDPQQAKEETQYFIDEILASQKSSIRESQLNESVLGLVNFTSQTQSRHDNSLKIDQSKNLHLLSNWNLPKSIVNEYKKKNVIEMFDWQVECLKNPKVLFEGANLVYSAPTSAGKTLVSEILMTKSIVERKKKALFILPFVSVVREKMFYLQDLMTSSGLRVEGFFGGYHPPGGFESIDLAVCTIEKANSIVNKLLEQDKLNTIDMIVIDEVHLISDPSRGYILELLLTKILYMCEKYQHQIQLVTMSATLPNVELLRKWLKAEFYYTDYRPVELKEMIKINNQVFNSKMELIRSVNVAAFKDFFVNDVDEVCQMGMETIVENCQFIVFCPSKDWCEQLSTNFARGIHNIMRSKPELIENVIDKSRLQLIVEKAKNLPSGIDEILLRNLAYSSAFHHAGLTTDERDLIEMGFKDGAIKALFATSTLSSGVNLPARRVIIRTPMFGKKMMSNLTYRQMIGRAGRKGKDTLGESILICNDTNLNMGKQLVVTPLEPLKSCLDADNHAHLKRALLEIIASGVANTRKDLENFVNSTLFCQQNQIDLNFFKETGEVVSNVEKKKSTNDIQIIDNLDEKDPIRSSMEFLLEYEFIRIHKDDETEESKFVPTRLGLACLSSAIQPKDGFILFSELQKSRQNFVLESELHAVYLVTPLSVAYQLQNIDWVYFADIYEKLPDMMKRVGSLVGVNYAYLIKAIRGQQGSDWRAQQVHKRFYTALALQELINEKSISEVSTTYKISRGVLQNLQQMASTFAGVVTTFCKSLDWNLLALILTQFRERLYFGIHPDLIDLMKIPSMSSTRVARALYKNGIEKLSELASSKTLQVENILIDVGESFFVAGKTVDMSFQEMAKLLIQDARNFIQNENGLRVVQWTQENYEDETAEKVEQHATDRINNKRKVGILTPEQNSLETPKRRKLPVASSTIHRVIAANVSSDNTPDTRVNVSLFANSDLESSDQFSVIDLLTSEEIFTSYKNEILTAKEIGMSIGVSKMARPTQMIGANLLQSPEHLENNENDDHNFVYDEKFYIDCISLSWHGNQVLYMDLQKNDQHLVSRAQQLVLDLLADKHLVINIFDARDSLKIIHKAFGRLKSIQARFQDPRVACWLIDPDTSMTWNELIHKYSPQHVQMFEKLIKTSFHGSLGLAHKHQVDARRRTSMESFLTTILMHELLEVLKSTGNGALVKVFNNLEMAIQMSLYKMEITGFPIDERKLYSMIEDGTSLLRQLENYIFTLNDGRKFNLSSSREISKVVGIHKNAAKKKISTAKNVLEKIDLPIAKTIMLWRTLDKTLSNMKPKVKLVKDSRIFATSFSFTQTGRISMYEPNLQNVTKDFVVELNDNNGVTINKTLSYRSIFQCLPGKRLLAADFCQLELRILTHLCKDQLLLRIMNTPGDDIFRKIAAKWNKIDETSVTDEQRNQTKQLCYGIIYGMGNRALAETMNVDEEAAARLSTEFHATYPGIKRYRQEVVEKTRERGFCHTLIGRRRYLPAITSTDSAAKSQAERQAINTCIQGTASDLVKNAMIIMEKNLYKNSLSSDCKLVLHLHDELFYEVNESKLDETAKVLIYSMENAVKLSVPLKVKLKTGRNWGDMQAYE